MRPEYTGAREFKSAINAAQSIKAITRESSREHSNTAIIKSTFILASNHKLIKLQMKRHS